MIRVCSRIGLEAQGREPLAALLLLKRYHDVLVGHSTASVGTVLLQGMRAPALVEGRLQAAPRVRQRLAGVLVEGHGAVDAAKVRGRAGAPVRLRSVAAQPEVDQLGHVLLPCLPGVPAQGMLMSRRERSNGSRG